jgi:hypothetical protein
MPRMLVAALAAVPCFILLLPAFVLAAALRLFSAAARALAGIFEPRFVPWTELMAFEPQLGWQPRPLLDAHYLAEGDDVFRVVTDEEGWPGRRSIEDSRVVVVGDSFAFGYGVNTNRSFAELDPAMRVKALGAPGYSMVHGVMLMERLAARLQGKLVVWFVYPENDLQDNLAPEMRGYRAPFVRRRRREADWEIVHDHVHAAPWACSNLDRRRLFPEMCVEGPIADRAYSACEYLMRRAVAACSHAGARLAVFTVPHPMQLTTQGIAELARLSGRPEHCDHTMPDRRLIAICQRLGVPITAGTYHLTRADYKRREGIHWNERGHRRVAAIVRRIAESAESSEHGSRVHADQRAPLPEPVEHAHFGSPSRT